MMLRHRRHHVPSPLVTAGPSASAPCCTCSRSCTKPLVATWRLSSAAPLLCFDLFESGPGALELIVEQPHRIEDFAKSRGDFCSVGLAEREHAVVAQVCHDRCA